MAEAWLSHVSCVKWCDHGTATPGIQVHSHSTLEDATHVGPRENPGLLSLFLAPERLNGPTPNHGLALPDRYCRGLCFHLQSQELPSWPAWTWGQESRGSSSKGPRGRSRDRRRQGWRRLGSVTDSLSY